MIILWGAPGSGKSLQGQRLAEKYGFVWLSVGQILRDMQGGIPGLKAKMERGELVDDQLVIETMREAIARVEHARKIAILDGYPRDQKQAEAFLKGPEKKYLQGVVKFVVPKAEILKRLKLRGREDDTEKVVTHRLKIFKYHNERMEALFRENGVKIEAIDGVGNLEEVQARLEQILGDWKIISLAKLADEET